MNPVVSILWSSKEAELPFDVDVCWTFYLNVISLLSLGFFLVEGCQKTFFAVSYLVGRNKRILDSCWLFHKCPIVIDLSIGNVDLWHLVCFCRDLLLITI